MWAPGDGVLVQVAFPLIRTFDSSRTPQRAERLVTPGTLAQVDLSAITAALTDMKASTANVHTALTPSPVPVVQRLSLTWLGVPGKIANS